MIPLYENLKVDTHESIVDPEHQQAARGSITTPVAPLVYVTDNVMLTGGSCPFTTDCNARMRCDATIDLSVIQILRVGTLNRCTGQCAVKMSFLESSNAKRML